MTPSLVSQRLKYVPLTSGHLSKEYVQWLNNPIVYKYLETGGDYSMEKLQSYLLDVEKKDILFWGIHITENDKHIGNIKIDPVNKKHGYGEYGILMGDEQEWGKGYAFEASTTIIKYCFEVLKLRKITLGVVEDNVNAVKLYRKIGFTIEGIYKEHFLYESKYLNALRMVLFNSQYSR